MQIRNRIDRASVLFHTRDRDTLPVWASVRFMTPEDEGLVMTLSSTVVFSSECTSYTPCLHENKHPLPKYRGLILSHPSQIMSMTYTKSKNARRAFAVTVLGSMHSHRGMSTGDKISQGLNISSNASL